MFKTFSRQYQKSLILKRPAFSARHAFGISLFAILLLLFCFRVPAKNGDFAEYGAMTIAFASHGTPDIRLPDIQKAKRLNPEPFFSGFYQGLEDGVRAHSLTPAIAFYRGGDDNYYAIHFFAYSAIAAIPFAVFDAAGISPFKCYQFVNLACIYLLGIVSVRFFRSIRRAAAAVGLFFLCGGALYWNWTSPEVMTAAFLLAGLMLYLTDAPFPGAVLAGFAAMQNPPLVLFAGFAPLLQLFYRRSQGNTWTAAWKLSASAKNIAALALFVLLFLLPILFNLRKFGVPSLIAAGTTNPGLISGLRLFSFFFDLNQGMIVGVPALFAALGLLFFSARTGSMRLLACTALLFSVGMAIPALSTQNWNSGAAGMMRYAFWAAMPILLVCLLHAREQALSPVLILAVFVVQAGATVMESRYRHVEFSPVARFVLAHFPSAYNPAFEVFSERLQHQESFVSKNDVLYYKVNGHPTKIAFNLENKEAGLTICGKNRVLSLDTGLASVDDGWAYLNTAPVCNPVLTEDAVYGARDFANAAGVKFIKGWGSVEFGGANWDGIWTTAPVAALDITPPSNVTYKTLSIQGQYIAPGMETDVSVNGVHVGRFALDRGLPIPVKGALRNHEGRSIVELRHVPGNSPAPANGDKRQLGFFVTKIVLGKGQP
ncbi:MAG: hypothetical protein WCC39_11285 [Telluria sp.]